MKRLLIACAIILTMLLAACKANTEQPEQTQVSQEAVTVSSGVSADWFEQSAEGEVLTVRLKANPTTGYQWTFEISDEEILELLTEEYAQEPGKEDMDGVGGIWCASFKPTFRKDGDVKLTLKYGRSWESQPSFIKVLMLTVKGRKITVNDFNELEKELPVIPDGEYSVELTADGLKKDGDVIVAELTEPKPIVLSDEEVKALKAGSEIDLTAYGRDPMSVEKLEKQGENTIEINEFARLKKDNDLGGWKIVVENDDVITYPVLLGQATFDDNTEFEDELSKIAYDDANKFENIYDCVQNYKSVNAEVTMEGLHVKKVKVLYHP